MRKAYRSPGSRSSCPLCHPEKAGWERRWKPKQEERLRRFEREVREMTHTTQACGKHWDDL